MKCFPLTAFFLAWLGISCQPKEPVRTLPPNIVLIVADDLGWGDLGCYGETFIETPFLDRMAAEGVAFSQGYAAAPLCSPTRASIQTGLSPARINLTEHIHGFPEPRPDQAIIPPRIEQGLSLDHTDLGSMLKQAGYVTAHIGKWHLGGGEFSPEHRGYDLAFAGSWAGLPPTFFYPFFPGGAYPELRTISQEGDYLPDVLTRRALDFIEAQRDTSFFVGLHFYAPHVPIEAPDSLVEIYRQKRGGAPDSLLPNVHYAAMVSALDRNVGRVLETLERLGLRSHTLVVFVSDNGGLDVREVPAFAQHTPPTTNAPLRAGKGYLYEGGIREPFLFWGLDLPAKPEMEATPIITHDLYNTFASLAGQESRSPDGIDLMPLLQGKAVPERALHWHFPHYSPQGGMPGAVIRQGTYKLIEWYEDGSYDLYDLLADPGEQQNLVGEQPKRVEALKAALSAWRDSVGAKMPEPNPDFRSSPSVP
ncbi:MAG: DUF4976 domain-containing protein [Bacteroidetes bacterium]|nr:MAG: DUF4976 domain-containing protein [Bacteroidota bacterium]